MEFGNQASSSCGDNQLLICTAVIAGHFGIHVLIFSFDQQNNRYLIPMHSSSDDLEKEINGDDTSTCQYMLLNKAANIRLHFNTNIC